MNLEIQVFELQEVLKMPSFGYRGNDNYFYAKIYHFREEIIELVCSQWEGAVFDDLEQVRRGLWIGQRPTGPGETQAVS